MNLWMRSESSAAASMINSHLDGSTPSTSVRAGAGEKRQKVSEGGLLVNWKQHAGIASSGKLSNKKNIANTPIIPQVKLLTRMSALRI